MKNQNTGKLGGFTLIELLVVVLIIGILSAIAVPQYQKAVEKAKATQALVILKSFGQAMQSYFMANGTYPSSWEELDISVPWGEASKKWWTASVVEVRAFGNNDWSFHLVSSNKTNTYSVMMGRISGPYEGAGWYYSVKDQNIYCVERISSGIAFKKDPGDYCVKLFHGTFYSESEYTRTYTVTF